ncbi:hypothetical protein [Butyrivibrio sp. VCB2006]|uniref:hypothetical protein n=1 Tax=Butyrivibrio sp. VCB2006 TaxID=1280679 RepID=UPI00042263AE|nr:hypothetical protein [Butyrivibrio sp. VCB2006]
MDSNNMNQNQQPVNTPPVGQQNVYVQPAAPETETPNSVGDWVLTIFLTCIPCVGLILLFVWAFGSNTNKSKANWAKAQLIWAAIGVVALIIFYVAIGAALLAEYGGL